MLYGYDLRKTLRRYSPVWFRWPENQSFAYALCRRLVTLDVWFGRLRNDVAKEWEYNGLMHSLEWALNDKFDNVQRRIKVEDQAQVPYLFYRDAADLPVERIGEASEPSPYYIMDAQQLSGAVAYRQEFTIVVPDTLGVNAKAIFNYVDIYRLAGRRPRIRWDGFFFDTFTYYDEING